MMLPKAFPAPSMARLIRISTPRNEGKGNSSYPPASTRLGDRMPYTTVCRYGSFVYAPKVKSLTCVEARLIADEEVQANHDILRFRQSGNGQPVDNRLHDLWRP